MSDYFSDASRWEHFLDNLAPWQRDAVDAIENFRFTHLGQSVMYSSVFDCLKESDVEVLDKRWVLKYMEYLCVIGFAAPVFEGWVFGREY